MGLQSIYQQFLAAPHASSLADNASLHYITTLTTLNGAAEIIKHLKGRDYDLKLKEEKFLDVVEAADAVAVEVSTTIEFLAGGGAYLPKLDDNFLADRTVTFPIVCWLLQFADLPLPIHSLLYRSICKLPFQYINTPTLPSPNPHTPSSTHSC